MAQRPPSLKFPTRRAVASLALVSVISAIENQRKSKSQHPGEEEFASQDMSGELQTIPARHGVATFVPRGRTIKIINTYGKQVVSTWAFGLHAPPQEGDDGEGGEEEAEDIEEKVGELKKGLKEEGDEKQEDDNSKETGSKEEVEEELNKEVEQPKEDAEGAEDKPKDEPQPGHNKPGKETSNEENPSQDSKGSEDPPEEAPTASENQPAATNKKGGKRTWASYLPSIPYRNKNQGAGKGNENSESKADAKSEKEKNEATSKAWSSYMPTGKGFSSYVPNVQLPDSQGVVSAFKSSHYRDPNKSYAEQLYDFSKTPVGAGGIAVATGSGTASSIYAAYSAYTKMAPSKDSQPPMEYLSLPHTRASSHRLVPVVDDTLLTNLRNPIMTLIEDTSPGAHDTLTAACDASQYAALGVDTPEEHGSCAENLVLALKELNEKAGLQGTKAVGADITVNIAPTPLHLFMNAPIELDSSVQGEGTGAKGATLKVAEPQGKKRNYVRFRADRDIVVVLSACPMDVGSQNGGKCMAANFMVEPEDEKEGSSASGKKRGAPKKLNQKKKDGEETPAAEKKDGAAKPPNVRGGPRKPAAVKASAERRDSSSDPAESGLPEESGKEPQKGKQKEEPKKESKQEKDEPKAEPKKESKQKKDEPTDEPQPQEQQQKPQPEEKKQPTHEADQQPPDQGKAKSEEPASEETPKPKNKPKKLQRRGAGGGSTTPAKSESS